MYWIEVLNNQGNCQCPLHTCTSLSMYSCFELLRKFCKLFAMFRPCELFSGELVDRNYDILILSLTCITDRPKDGLCTAILRLASNVTL